MRNYLAPLETPLLAPREKEILALAHQGKSNAEISAALHIGVGTVKVHLQHAILKHRDAEHAKNMASTGGPPDIRHHSRL